jgi:hypothetical protein
MVHAHLENRSVLLSSIHRWLLLFSAGCGDWEAKPVTLVGCDWEGMELFIRIQECLRMKSFREPLRCDGTSVRNAGPEACWEHDFSQLAKEKTGPIPKKEGRRQMLILDDASWHKAARLNWHHFEPKFLPGYSLDFNSLGNFVAEEVCGARTTTVQTW